MNSRKFTNGKSSGSGLDFEMLAGYVLGGSKARDPFNVIWDANFYSEILPVNEGIITEKGKHILSLLVTTMGMQHQDSKHLKTLIEIDKQIWQTPKPDEVLHIIDRIHDIAVELAYLE